MLERKYEGVEQRTALSGASRTGGSLNSNFGGSHGGHGSICDSAGGSEPTTPNGRNSGNRSSMRVLELDEVRGLMLLVIIRVRIRNTPL